MFGACHTVAPPFFIVNDYMYKTTAFIYTVQDTHYLCIAQDTSIENSRFGALAQEWGKLEKGSGLCYWQQNGFIQMPVFSKTQFSHI